MRKDFNIVLAGVGGQGTLVAGKLLGVMAVKMNWDIKVSEVHGMSQRGGSVVTYVRMGEKVYSPVIEEGLADFVLAFEEVESIRWASLLTEGGTMIINSQRILPVTVKTGNAVYPSDILDELKNASKPNTEIIEICADVMALESGNIRCVNMVMLGAMSRYTDIPQDTWTEAINEVFPEKLRAMNLKAFTLGKNS